jgi:hypothetical protein
VRQVGYLFELYRDARSPENEIKKNPKYSRRPDIIKRLQNVKQLNCSSFKLTLSVPT